MQITAGLAAVALATATLAGGVAGAAIHATTTATVRVECIAPAPTPAGDDDMRRFMAPPAPAFTGNPRY